MHVDYAELTRDGRISIPAALRAELGLNPGDTVVIECDGDSLLVRGYDRFRKETDGPPAPPA